MATGQNLPVPDHRSSDLALRRFDALLRYLGTETSGFWSRSQLFLVANAALFGLVVGAVAKEKNVPGQAKGIFLLATLVGVLLTVFWIQALRSSSEKIDRWIAVLMDLEPEAFGPYNLFRDFVHGRSRRIAEKPAWLFMALWIILLSYVVWLPIRW